MNKYLSEVKEHVDQIIDVYDNLEKHYILSRLLNSKDVLFENDLTDKQVTQLGRMLFRSPLQGDWTINMFTYKDILDLHHEFFNSAVFTRFD